MSLPSTPLVPSEIAAGGLQDPSYPQIQLQSTEHRIALVEQWDIKPGSRVLEVGCGQGDCTTVLATAVGDTGHITAIDPGAPDYGTYLSSETVCSETDHVVLGSPYTLAQAQ